MRESYPTTNPLTGTTWIFSSGSGPRQLDAIFDFPRYNAWSGWHNNALDRFSGTNDIFQNTLPENNTAFPRFGLAWCTFGLTHELIAGPTLNYADGAADLSSNVLAGQYFLNSSNPADLFAYGTGSANYQGDRAAFVKAYPKFYRHKTVVFHNHKPYGFVSGIDSPRFGPITSDCFAFTGGFQTIAPTVTFDMGTDWARQYAQEYLQGVCTDLKDYGFTYGGTCSEDSTIDDFMPAITEFLNN